MVIVSESIARYYKSIFSVLELIKFGQICKDNMSLYDIFDIYQPQIIFIHSDQIKPEHENIILNNKTVKWVIFGPKPIFNLNYEIRCHDQYVARHTAKEFHISRHCDPINMIGNENQALKCKFAIINDGKPITKEQDEFIYKLVNSRYGLRAYGFDRPDFYFQTGVADIKDIYASSRCIVKFDKDHIDEYNIMMNGSTIVNERNFKSVVNSGWLFRHDSSYFNTWSRKTSFDLVAKLIQRIDVPYFDYELIFNHKKYLIKKC